MMTIARKLRLMIVSATALLGIAAAPAVANFGRVESALDRDLRSGPRYMPPPGKFATTGQFTVALLPYEEVQRICQKLTASSGPKLACVDCPSRQMTILEPSDRRIRYSFREVFEHEASHCAGYIHPR